jgi:hypothetical protein
MDTNADRPDDLSDVERRLSAWQPDSTGLNADAMLFAAGRAAARPGPTRFVWPALTGVMTVLIVVLGVGLANERTARQLLAEQIRQPAPAPSPAPSFIPTELPTSDEPGPSSLFASHRALEQGLDAWPSRAMVRVEPPQPPLPDEPVLSVGQRNALLDP